MMASFRSPARLYLRATYTSPLFDRGHATTQGRGTELNLRATYTSALFDRGHATTQGRGTELNLRATYTSPCLTAVMQRHKGEVQN